MRLTAVPTAAVAMWLAGSACGTGAVGVGECRQIEAARCRQAVACGISIEPPYYSSGTDVGACIRFYDTACLHGLTVADPGASAVNACVAAIESGDCTLVITPETGACAWLAPPAPVVIPVPDAAEDATEEPSDSD
jgi:hypothetical protein